MLAGGAGSQSNGQGGRCWEVVLVHGLMARASGAGLCILYYIHD